MRTAVAFVLVIAVASGCATRRGSRVATGVGAGSLLLGGTMVVLGAIDPNNTSAAPDGRIVAYPLGGMLLAIGLGLIIGAEISSRGLPPEPVPAGVTAPPAAHGSE